MAEYDFKGFEQRWQAEWKKLDLFRCDTSATGKKPFYCLMMFPYPSGDLHVGHGRNYLIGDTLVRYHLMKGESVLSPMGWDAFGLPAENAAIKNNVHPAAWTKKNIAAMKAQFDRWGVGYDWSRELSTCDPDYYKWTQWVFCRLFDAGLVYRKKSPVNWCPSCKTVLANDQVIDGKCERCSSVVERRELEQWFVKITQYAQKLLDGLDRLPKWPEQVKNLQRARIGRSEGAIVKFVVAETGAPIPCFTTRPDTLWGVMYFSVAPEHPVVAEVLKTATAEKKKEIETFRAETKQQTTVEREQAKRGVATGWHVINPVNGEKVPLWLANYVLMEYGTGAVMAVPAHDERDFEFAKVYKLPIKIVIDPTPAQLVRGDLGPVRKAIVDAAHANDPRAMTTAYTEDGVMIRSGPLEGTASPQGIGKVIDWLEKEGKATRSIQWKMHDWCISRQRYWGAPIPIIHCAACGPVRVPTEQLPVELPVLDDFKPKGRSVLEGVPEFMATTCPKCGAAAKRDPDTLDTFVDSAWYFLRYPNPTLGGKPFDKGIVDRWLPVHQYVGGREHATGHLLYSRFIVKALHDLGELGFDEPFEALFCQGMIGMQSFWSAKHGWVSWKEADPKPEHAVDWYDTPKGKVSVRKGDPAPQGSGDDVKKLVTSDWTHPDGSPLFPEYFKMSKTRLNLVSASEMGDKFGVDVQRLYTLAVGPAEDDAEWKDTGSVGYLKFLKRALLSLENLGAATKADGAVDPTKLSAPIKDLRRKAHEVIGRVTTGLELDREGRFGFHTAVSALIELEHTFPDPASVVTLDDKRGVHEAVGIFTRLIAPIAPHFAEEAWHTHLGQEGTIFRASWPVADPSALVRSEVEIAVQIQGKPKAKAMVPPDADEAALRAIVLELPKVKEELAGKSIKKFIVVKKANVNNIVNIVAG